MSLVFHYAKQIIQSSSELRNQVRLFSQSILISGSAVVEIEEAKAYFVTKDLEGQRIFWALKLLIASMVQRKYACNLFPESRFTLQ